MVLTRAAFTRLPLLSVRYKIAGISNFVILIGLQRRLQQCRGCQVPGWPMCVCACVCIFCHSTLRDTLHHCRCLRSAYARAPWGITSETPRFDAQRCSSTPFHCTVQYVVVPHHMSLMHVDLCVRACVH